MTTSTRSGDNLRLIHELMPAAEKLVERHISSAKEWFPHLYVPWSRGRDFEPDEAWDPAEFPVPDAVRDALFVNLLTEDNLPYYFHTIDNIFGPGVPARYREHIFDRFIRLDDARSRPDGDLCGGSGLGLAICREIVTAHGGRIWADEARGGGARFVVQIPA